MAISKNPWLVMEILETSTRAPKGDCLLSCPTDRPNWLSNKHNNNEPFYISRSDGQEYDRVLLLVLAASSLFTTRWYWAGKWTVKQSNGFDWTATRSHTQYWERDLVAPLIHSQGTILVKNFFLLELLSCHLLRSSYRHQRYLQKCTRNVVCTYINSFALRLLTTTPRT